MSLIKQYNKNELQKIANESNSYRDMLKKIGYHTYNGSNHKTLKKAIAKYDIDISHFDTKKIIRTQRTEDNVFCKNSTATQKILRTWFIKGNYVEYKCDKCGLKDVWMNEKITLQLDHINGDNHDNRLSNLRWLCPNCHSQTSTYCGKSSHK